MNQTEANLAKDKATLAQVQANLVRDQAQEEYARAETERYANLLERRLVSKEQAEQMKSNARATSAAVNADMAGFKALRRP